jgi:hypothetical protein
MNSRFIIAVLIGLSAVMSVKSVDAAPDLEDHLVPFRPSLFDKLRPLLYKKLLLTQGNYGRMVDFVGDPYRGEFAVSVQCDERPGVEKQCSVTLVKVTRNLGAILEENLEKGSLEALEKVSVVRRDASIASSTASAIRSTWIRFLRDVRRRRPNGSVVMDAERIEFFVGAPTPKRNFGEVPDRYGRSISDLVALGRALARYCEETDTSRPQVAAKIESDAKRLAPSK